MERMMKVRITDLPSRRLEFPFSFRLLLTLAVLSSLGQREELGKRRKLV
jgi:hypothetical protein